jgi:hypothetical protein
MVARTTILSGVQRIKSCQSGVWLTQVKKAWTAISLADTGPFNTGCEYTVVAGGATYRMPTVVSGQINFMMQGNDPAGTITSLLVNSGSKSQIQAVQINSTNAMVYPPSPVTALYQRCI